MAYWFIFKILLFTQCQLACPFVIPFGTKSFVPIRGINTNCPYLLLQPLHQHGTNAVCLSLSNQDDAFPEASDLEALQRLFTKYCDKEGLMTKTSVTQVPAIAALMVRPQTLDWKSFFFGNGPR